MSRHLQEQTIVITGASSGIGRETALQAGCRGASVIVAARSGDALREAELAIMALTDPDTKSISQH